MTFKIGDRVQHKTIKCIRSKGTIIDVEEPFHVPFTTADIDLDPRFKVKWDNKEYGESNWINGKELELVLESV